jgi:hypothetical protein
MYLSIFVLFSVFFSRGVCTFPMDGWGGLCGSAAAPYTHRRYLIFWWLEPFIFHLPSYYTSI